MSPLFSKIKGKFFNAINARKSIDENGLKTTSLINF